MFHRSLPALTSLFAVALVCAAATASADPGVQVGVHEAPLVNELRERATDLEGAADKASKKARKLFLKVLKKLDKGLEKDSYKKRIAAVGFGAKQIEKKLADDTELAALFAPILANFRGDVTFFRNRVEQIGDAAGEGSKAFKKSRKRVGKADGFMAGIDTEPLASKKFKLLQKAVVQTTEPSGADDLEHAWIIFDMSSATPELVPDLNGDGVGDSALEGVFQQARARGADSLGGFLEQFEIGNYILLLQLADLDSLAFDPAARFGVAVGLDTDDEPEDNYGGNEEFTVPAGLDTSGRFTTGGSARVSQSELQVCFEGGPSFAILGVTIAPQRTAISAVVSPGSANGFLSVVISAAEAEAIVAALNVDPPLTPQHFQSALDIDMDGDGTPDAISASFRFDANGATIQR